jgi:hypothetical protein
MHRLRTLLAGTLGTIVLGYLFHLPWKLIEAAIFETIIHEIRKLAGPMTPAFQHALNWVISWGPPAAAAAACVWLIYRTGFGHGTRAQVSGTVSPPRDTVATDAAPRGDKLITLGQNILIFTGIITIVGMVAGLTLMIIGSWRSGEFPIREAAKVKQDARPSDVQAPEAPTRPRPIPELSNIPAPLTVAPPQITKPPRNFVEAHVTPEFLLKLRENNTALRAEVLIAEQLGKWMRVVGPLGEIHPGMSFGGSKTPTMVVFSYDRTTRVYMWFSPEWNDRLALLTRGEKISVVGKLKEADHTKVQLEDCELEPIADAPAQSPSPSARPRRRQSARRTEKK